MDYPSKNPNKRSKALKVMLRPDAAEKLNQVADLLGQTPATLASVYIGQQAATQLAALKAGERAVDGFVSQLAPDVMALLKTVVEAKNEAS